MLQQVHQYLKRLFLQANSHPALAEFSGRQIGFEHSKTDGTCGRAGLRFRHSVTRRSLAPVRRYNIDVSGAAPKRQPESKPPEVPHIFTLEATGLMSSLPS